MVSIAHKGSLFSTVGLFYGHLKVNEFPHGVGPAHRGCVSVCVSQCNAPDRNDLSSSLLCCGRESRLVVNDVIQADRFYCLPYYLRLLSVSFLTFNSIESIFFFTQCAIKTHALTLKKAISGNQNSLLTGSLN